MNSEILEQEKKYWSGMENHDFDLVKGLTRFPCIVAGKNGIRSVDPDSFKKMFESHRNVTIKAKNISGVETQMLSGNVAIIGYLVELEFESGGNKSTSKCACTSTWQRENDKWLVAIHSETELEKNG